MMTPPSSAQDGANHDVTVRHRPSRFHIFIEGVAKSLNRVNKTNWCTSNFRKSGILINTKPVTGGC
jgi:hypothetical protein